MARYGERDAVSLMLDELYASAAHFQMRLPELFCGFNRQTGEPPIPYPVACMPQAWAAGSVFLMLQASLGVSINALAGTIRVDRPCLPSGLDRLTVAGLAVGETRLDLTFQRTENKIAVWPTHHDGPALKLHVGV